MLNDNDNDNDNDVALFKLDQHEGRARLIFTTFTTLTSKMSGQIPLWWHDPADDMALHSMTVWLGEHRARWTSWRKIAERDGIQAVSDELARLWAPGIEACHSMMMAPGDDPRELTFLAMLVTRNSEIVRHRFASARHRRVFTDWYLRDIEANSGFLLFEGCLIGPKHLAGILDGIAAAELAAEGHARARRTHRHPCRAARA